jgi:protein-S-isoprenylcysteine O-methyltransferase Ste14
MSKSKVYPPTYLLLSLLTVIALHFLLPALKIVPSPWNAIGVIFLITGIVINLQAEGLFHRAGTTVKPGEESNTLLTEGIFRISRNPMYFGFALILFGAVFLFGTLSPFLVVPVFMVLIEKRFILSEERMLEQKFGKAYLEYRKTVRRWI